MKRLICYFKGHRFTYYENTMLPSGQLLVVRQCKCCGVVQKYFYTGV